MAWLPCSPWTPFGLSFQAVSEALVEGEVTAALSLEELSMGRRGSAWWRNEVTGWVW